MDDWLVWLNSLDRIAELAPKFILPGHGPVAKGKEVRRLWRASAACCSDRLRPAARRPAKTAPGFTDKPFGEMETTIIANGLSLSAILRAHAEWMQAQNHGQSGDGRCILDGATLNGINLTGAELHGAILRGTTLLDAELSDAKLGQAIIDAADFQRALLGRTDFSEARIAESNFEGSWMSETSFSDAQIRNRELSQGHSAGGAFSRRAAGRLQIPVGTAARRFFPPCPHPPMRFLRYRLERCAICSRAGRKQPLCRMQRAGHQFQQLPPQVCDFTTLRSGARARFNGADLNGSQFDRTQLQEADFRNAQLSGVLLGRADLSWRPLRRRYSPGSRFAGRRPRRARVN